MVELESSISSQMILADRAVMLTIIHVSNTEWNQTAWPQPIEKTQSTKYIHVVNKLVFFDQNASI